jgi:transposase
MNRKQRREMTRKIQSEDIRLEVIHPDAAGIDIGNESHYVAVPSARDSEAGRDMSNWETEDHFVSWLRLCPDNRISGDKIIGKGRLPTNNRVSIALKMAANNLRTSKTYLGAQFRRLRSRLDTPVAIKAMAAKLARLVYRMLRYGMKYVDRGAAFYEAQHRQLQIKHLKSKAAKLGFQIIQVPAA